MSRAYRANKMWAHICVSFAWFSLQSLLAARVWDAYRNCMEIFRFIRAYK